MNTRGFYKASEARQKSPVVSRPDLVAERNAASDNSAPSLAAAIADKGTDNNVYCFRPDGTMYAVLTRTQWKDLRERKQLDAWLTEQRESGVILEVNRS